jgi:hypothetical protein
VKANIRYDVVTVLEELTAADAALSSLSLMDDTIPEEIKRTTRLYANTKIKYALWALQDALAKAAD